MGHYLVPVLAVPLLLLILLIAGCGHVQDHVARNDGMPRDVGSFLDRRSACGDARTDDVFDDGRDSFMMDQSAMYCTGTDAELKRLRTKYAARPDVLAALDRLEADIENRR